VIWTIDTQDYLMAGNPLDLFRIFVRQDRAGRKQNRDQIVLMHDIHPQDAQTLPGIIDHFEHSDRKFVSVNELLTNKCLEP
jgi:peptidoglycan/xylan/chitin deacetylase (PgdA/CDA1 family)